MPDSRTPDGQTAGEYSLWTEHPDDMRYRLLRDFIGTRVDPRSQYAMLDMGFASMGALETATHAFPNISGYGCDISAGKVSEAAAGSGDFELKVVDLNEPEGTYPECCFDFIFAGEIIEHLWNTDGCLVEARRILKPGGYLVVTTPNMAAWYERLLLLFGFLPMAAEVSRHTRLPGRKVVYRLSRREDTRPVGHLRLFTPAALRDLAEYHGLAFVEHRGYHTYDFPLNALISRLYKRMAQGIFMVFRKPREDGERRHG